MPEFSMESFMKSLEYVSSRILLVRRIRFCVYRSRKDEIDLEIFDMLVSFTDFLTFKEMFVSYKKVSMVVLPIVNNSLEGEYQLM